MKNRIIETKLVNWRDIEPLQPEESKIRVNTEWLKNSLEKYGFSMPFYGWEHKGKIYCIDGHERKKVLSEMTDVPEMLPVTLLEAKNRKEAVKILVTVFNQKHNRFDSNVLTDWLGIEEIEMGEIDLESINVKIETEKEIGEKANIFVPDCLFPSNNTYDIPTLKIDMAGNYPELPFKPYGADSRVKGGVGTYHFYVDDYRFEAIWNDPTNILNSGCSSIIEPNLSLFDTTPISYGLYLIYKKRWISRFLQENGIKVFADLNVSIKFKEYNTFGIPEGYNAFCTRGYSGKINYLKEELEIAKSICKDNELHFIVYGGGKDVKQFVAENNLIYIQDFINTKDI